MTLASEVKNLCESREHQDNFDQEIKQLKGKHPNISFGYIGNVNTKPGYPPDERDWYVWNGKNKFGGYSTKQLPAMWDLWQKNKEKFLAKGDK
jgi:hypothetical protein